MLGRLVSLTGLCPPPPAGAAQDPWTIMLGRLVSLTGLWESLRNIMYFLAALVLGALLFCISECSAA